MNELDTLNKLKIIQLLENPSNNKNALKLSNYFKSYIDTIRRNKLELKPIEQLLNQINSITTKEDLNKTIINLHKIGVDILFSMYVEQDLKNASQYAIYLNQSGIGLPNKSYYTDENKKSILKEY